VRKLILDGVERRVVFYRLIQDTQPIESYIVQYVVKDLDGKELFIHEENGSGVLNHGGDLYSVLTLELLPEDV